MHPRFAIGIDLGTTNCALASVALADEASRSVVLPVPQWVGPGRMESRVTLPSFLFRPLAGVRSAYSAGPGMVDDWVVGVAARDAATRTPGRVVHSAKSWLANHASDPAAQTLPWKGTELAPEERLSPLAASAALLRQLARAWAEARPDAPLADQSITVTVPASFDAAAQRATLEAAERAGFPPGVRLLEEPQAAFYRWLEAQGSGASGGLARGEHVLVVDVGGGTSDFSLFRVAEGAAIERVAVSEHLLLGGDNIDLALAHLLESALVPEGEQLVGEPWNHLVARARELKERALTGLADESLRVAVPGRGSGLLASTLSTEVPAGQLREVVLEGFFPRCHRDERPQEGRSALQEWGLPYAADFAVSRYLAAFLREHPPVDAVLFNGGTLAAPALRQRLVELVSTWQGGRVPRVLEGAEMDLAVARGAAAYGATLAGRGRRIAAGAARGIFLELGAAGAGLRPLLCILPRGASPGQVFAAAPEGLRVRVNERVRFRVLQGAHRRAEAAGMVCPWDATDFLPLPALETSVDWPRAASESLPVRLESCLNELGTLQVELVETTGGPGARRWALAFDLRGASEEAAPPPPATVEASAREAADEAPPELAAAIEGLRRAFATAGTGRDARLTRARVFDRLERILRTPRAAWTVAVVRSLGDALLDLVESPARSPEHLETWLHLAGWLLRPGFGAPGDEERLARLWALAGPSRIPPAKRTEAPFSLLWRRVAGGLGVAFQEALWESRSALWLDPGRSIPEGVRLAGALERLPPAAKRALVSAFAARAVELARAQGHPAPYLAALGGLLARRLTRPGGEVMPAAAVEEVWQRLAPLDWEGPSMAPVGPLFLRAARRTGVAALDLPERTRRRIADRLGRLGVSPQRLQSLREVIAIDAAELAEPFEEPLPPGLVLAPPGPE